VAVQRAVAIQQVVSDTRMHAVLREFHAAAADQRRNKRCVITTAAAAAAADVCAMPIDPHVD